MNTSEFEERPSESFNDPDSLIIHENMFPDDFSLEEAVFARELNDLFALDEEDTPPLFVQTLMAGEDPRFDAVETHFETKTAARVFRRLKLKRHLFHRQKPQRLFAFWSSGFSVPRSLVKLSIGSIVFMLATMVMAVPSFASGLNYLWAGAHAGVVQVDTYPLLSRSPHTSNQSAQNGQTQNTGNSSAESHTMDLVATQRVLHFPMFWPQYIPSRYQQSAIYLYPGDTSWSDGPVLVMDYAYSLPGIAPRQITICEFKPNGTVLQVVHNGAAHEIRMGLDEASSGVYVTGQWTQQSLSASPSWSYTDRSELIFEDQDTGVVFWIVGDKRDGIDENELSNIANSLHIFNLNNMHLADQLNRVTRGDGEAPDLFADDVIYLQNADNPDGPQFQLLGNNTSNPKNLHAH